MVSENEAYDPDLYGYFIVMQAGDTLAALDEQLGFSVLANSRAYGLLDAKPFIEAVNALMNESDEPADKKPQSLHWPVSLALNDLPCPPLGADRR